MILRLTAFAAIVVVVGRLAASSGQEISRSPFLAAEIGNFPNCKVYGRTYCLESPDYPKETIQYLLDNHLFDVSSIILSEGIPASEFGGHAETNSLEIEDSGKPKSNFVARNKTSPPESITVKVGQSFRHDNRPKRRDRNQAAHQKQVESRVLNHSSESDVLEENNKVHTGDYFSSSPRRPSAEFFRAGASDSDLLSLGELKPELLEISTNEEVEEAFPEIETRPRKIEIGKKTIFDELKDLDEAVFENQDSLFAELLAATSKSPKDPVPTEAVSVEVIEEDEDDDEAGEEEAREGGEEELEFVNNGGQFQPEVSSVLYEPPIPSKGTNFLNFRTYQDGGSTDQPAKTNSKRDKPVNPSDAQTGFLSFFNSDVIDDEIKNYREKLKQENPISFSKNDNSIDFGQTVEEPTGDSVKVEQLPIFDKPALDQFVISTGSNPGNRHQGPELLPIFQRPTQPEAPIFVGKPDNFPGNGGDDDLKAFHDELDKLINGENPNGEFKSFFRNPSSLSFETVDGSPIEISDQDLTIVTIAPSNFASDYPDNPAQDQNNPGSEDQYVSFKIGQLIGEAVSSSPAYTRPTPEPEQYSSEVSLEPITQPPALIGRYSNLNNDYDGGKKLAERAIYGQQITPNPNVVTPVFTQHRPKPQDLRHQKPEFDSHETTEIVYGSDENGETKIDVVVLETGKKADETDDPRKIFDFLYKNVQEVTPPPDLNLNDPNLHRQQDHHEGVYYKPVEKSPEPEGQGEVRYRPLVEVVDNPIFRSEITTAKLEDKNPFLNSAESADQQVYYKPLESTTPVYSSTKVFYNPVDQGSKVKKSTSIVPTTFQNDISYSQKISSDDDSSIETSEFEFKPVLNPPPEFFELRPVTKNLFQKFAKVGELETATASSTTAFLPEVTSSQAEYAEEDYNNYTEPPEAGHAFEDAQASEQTEQQAENFYQDYPSQQPVDPRLRRKTRKPVNTGIFTAFSRVSDVLDNLFTNGLRTGRFGRGRRLKRQAEVGLEQEVEEVCPTRKHFIHPTVAYSVKGQWLYVVNIAGNASHQQGIVTEECMTAKCNKVCTDDPTLEASCQPQFVQKRLVALHPNGEKLTSELFWFPATCSCKIHKA